MKPTVYKQIPLYRFLDFCLEASPSTGLSILDAGAGGKTPPLALFKSHGFDTYGVEIDAKALAEAKQFEIENHLNLGIIQGDMLHLPYEHHLFDFVYSYNSIFHMKKVDIDLAMAELHRVLKPGGLLFVNFLSIDDFRCGVGPNHGNHQYEQMDDEPVIHSYFDYDEADRYFEGMEILIKETRIIERIYEGERIRQGFVDYIVRKG